MSSWDHRIVQTKEGLVIFDVYYDDDGKPIGSNKIPTWVYGDSIEDIKAQLQLMLEALDLPILQEDEICSPS